MTIAKPGSAAIGAAATLLLAACGAPAAADPEFLAQSPRAIIKTAFAEMNDLTSARILGTVVTDDGRIKVDVRTDDEGTCTGSLQLERGRTQFIHTAETTWLKPDEDYWQASARSPQQARQIMARIGTSWTVAPPQSVDVDRICHPPSLLDGFKARKDGGEGRLSKGAVELIGDTEAIEINEKGGGQSSTVWVSVTSPHRVVRIQSRERGVGEAVSFEEFGVEVSAETPAPDDVVDLSAYATRVPRAR